VRQLGAEVAFGMPGGDSLPLVRALADEGVRFVLVRDEASAGFAADATAQLTGRVGICVSTLGPGLANLVGGVAGCTLDRAPVLAFTSRYRSDRHGHYTHMMLDQSKLMDATGKGWVRLTAANAAAELRRAAALALAPRPGAVWVEVPTEAASAPTVAQPLPVPPAPCGLPVDPALAAQVAGLQRPVVLVGFAGRHADVQGLAERLRAPVLTTYKAKGALPEGRGWSAGAAGLSPVADAVHQRQLLAKADGLLLVGWDPVELRDHWLPGWSDELPVVVLDTHAPTDLPTAMAGLHVGPLEEAVDSLIAGDSQWSPEEVAAHRAAHDAVFAEEGFGPAALVRAVAEAVADRPEVVATLDVGAHRITASHVWPCERPDTLLQSNGWASMGYGLPAALAANALGRPAVALTGDMGLQMVLGELGTAAELGGTLVVVAFLDRSLSLIELKQERLQHPRNGVGFTNPNLSSLAAAFGGVGEEASDAATLRSAVEQALERGGLTVIGARFDPAPYRRQM
jgi:acetolactate synthase-1/2/3 large subunit